VVLAFLFVMCLGFVFAQWQTNNPLDYSSRETGFAWHGAMVALLLPLSVYAVPRHYQKRYLREMAENNERLRLWGFKHGSMFGN